MTLTLPAKPKFMSAETFLQAKASQIECEKCHALRTLPPGKVCMTHICAACMLELEYDLKRKMGRLAPGETRPKRLKALSEAPGAIGEGIKT